jgi:hypothetical protein
MIDQQKRCNCNNNVKRRTVKKNMGGLALRERFAKSKRKKKTKPKKTP